MSIDRGEYHDQNNKKTRVNNMVKYKFEIQSSIIVVVKAGDVDTARQKLIKRIAIYADDMILGCVVSDGEECKGE
jgi:hypothetical protein